MPSDQMVDQPLPPEIRVEELLPDGVRYLLPRRPQKALRIIGPILVVVGVILIASFLLGLGFGSVFGVMMVAPGLYMTFGWSEITLQNGVLTNTEHTGPFFRRKRVQVSDVSGLAVRGHPNGNTTGDFFAVWAGSTPFAPGYPREWCNALARELGRRCLLDSTAAAKPQPVPVQLAAADGSADPDSSLVPLEQPPHSKIVVNDQPEGLTVAVPPAGMWSKGSGGLFVFAIVWCGLLTVFTAFTIAAAVKDPKAWFAVLFLGLFWAVGGGLMAWAVNMGRRRLDLAIAGGRLLAIKTSPFGVKQHEWDLKEIAKIAVGPSGMEVNDSPVMELQIKTQDGKKQGYLAGRELDELEWLASVLARHWRAFAQPNLSPDGTALPQKVALPADSPITLQDLPEGVTINVPPVGIKRGGGGVFFIGVWWLFSLAVVSFLAYRMVRGSDFFPLVVLACVGNFAIGVGLLLAGIHFGIRRAAIAIAGRRLLIIQTGLFGEKKHEWDADEIKQVCAGPSGMKVNNKDVLELQVHTLDGKKTGFLSGRSEGELYWLAATVGERLRKPVA